MIQIIDVLSLAVIFILVVPLIISLMNILVIIVFGKYHKYPAWVPITVIAATSFSISWLIWRFLTG